MGWEGLGWDGVGREVATSIERQSGEMEGKLRRGGVRKTRGLASKERGRKGLRKGGRKGERERRTKCRASTLSSSLCLYERHVSIIFLSANVKGPRASNHSSTTGSS